MSDADVAEGATEEGEMAGAPHFSKNSPQFRKLPKDPVTLPPKRMPAQPEKTREELFRENQSHGQEAAKKRATSKKK
ncbi:MAG: hypothetical protein KJN71_09545 [Acidimicrobiia bacterium]|nr:hypothetical protein [Acidimicrobiia bacterium]